MTKRYLSAKEVAELLGIAESTAYAVIRGGTRSLRVKDTSPRRVPFPEPTSRRSAMDLAKRNR